MKPVRLLCYMFLLGVRWSFGPDRAQRSVVFLSFEVTDQ